MKKLMMILSVMSVCTPAMADVGEYHGNVNGLFNSASTPERMMAGAYAGRCFTTEPFAGPQRLDFQAAAAVMIVLRMKESARLPGVDAPTHMMNIYYPNPGKIALDSFDQKTAKEILASTREAKYPFYSLFAEGKDWVAYFGKKPLKYTVRKNGEYWVVQGALTKSVGEMSLGTMMNCYFFKKLENQ